MAATLPKRRPVRSSPPPERRGAFVAATATAAVLVAFALGVLVGRRSTPPTPATTSTPAPAVTAPAVPAARPSKPKIELYGPDGKPTPVPAPAGEAQPAPAAPTPGDEAPARPEPPAASPQPAEPSAARREVPAATPKPTHPPAKAKRPRYTVQVAAFRDLRSAQKLMYQLEAKGYDAYVQKSEIPNKGTWYRVRIGNFATRAEADKVAKRIRSREGRAAYTTLR